MESGIGLPEGLARLIHMLEETARHPGHEEGNMLGRSTFQLLAAVCLVVGILLAPDSDTVGQSGNPDTNPDPFGGPRRDATELPMAFVENRGQVDSRVTHYLAGRDTTVFFTEQGLTFAMDGWAVKAEFVRASPHVEVAGGAAAGSVLTGPPDGWRTGTPAYRNITYRDPWPGVDIEYTSARGSLKYAFHLAPGANPAGIALAYRGASLVGLDSQGSLRLETPVGTLVDTAPIAYQDTSSGRKAVEIRYRMNGPRTVGFELGRYDDALPLVIDPEVLVFGSYLGSIENDRAREVVVDATGSAYILGHTRSEQFPATPGAFDTDYSAGFDVFDTKLTPDGSSLVYSTFLGASQTDEASAIAVDNLGNAYIGGFTQSFGFPITPNAFDTETEQAGDGFVTKLNPQGTDLVYSSYIGGTGTDVVSGIAIDARGAAYLSGSTFSSNFPVTPGALDGSLDGETDAFTSKVDPTGSPLMYSTYLGGNSSEHAFAIAVDSARRAYVAGESSSTSFPRPADKPIPGALAKEIVTTRIEENVAVRRR